MLKQVSGIGWQSISKKGDHLISLGGDRGRLQIEVHAKDGAALYGVLDGGELLYLDGGSVFEWSGVVEGFSGVTLETKGSGLYKASFYRASDPVDPVPMVVVDSLSPEEEDRIALREEIARVLAGSGILKRAGVDPGELVEEIDEDLEFFDDIDPEEEFGEGYMEQLGLEPNEEESRAALERPQQAPQEVPQEVQERREGRTQAVEQLAPEPPPQPGDDA